MRGWEGGGGILIAVLGFKGEELETFGVSCSSYFCLYIFEFSSVIVV